jgi:hypothetical protein
MSVTAERCRALGNRGSSLRSTVGSAIRATPPARVGRSAAITTGIARCRRQASHARVDVQPRVASTVFAWVCVGSREAAPDRKSRLIRPAASFRSHRAAKGASPPSPTWLTVSLREVPVGPDGRVGPGRQLDLMDPMDPMDSADPMDPTDLMDLLDDTRSTSATPHTRCQQHQRQPHARCQQRHPHARCRQHQLEPPPTCRQHRQQNPRPAPAAHP